VKVRIIKAALFFLCLGIAEPDAQEAIAPLVPPRPTNALYASAGIGFINIDGRGPGVRAPFGLTAVSNDLRLIARVNALDLGFLQGDDRDERYARSFSRSSRSPSSCFDTQTNRYVSNYRCSAGTDVLASSSFDLSYIVIEEIWIADQLGKIFVGGGLRLAKPQGGYGTVGFFFERAGTSSGGMQLMVGNGFVGIGLLWGYDLRRLF